MRVLHIIGSTDPRSGGPIEGILRQEEVTGGPGGFAVREIAALDPPGAPWLVDYPLEVHALGHPDRRRGPVGRLLDHYAYSDALVPWLRANVARFDLAFVHGLWNYSALAASRVLPGGRLPYFVFTHGMMDPWFRRQYPLKHWAKQSLWLASEGRLLAGARRVLFTCEEERRQAQGQFFGYSYREQVVGYGAAAPPQAEAMSGQELAAKVPALQGRPFLLFLSRIHEKKGCDLLIEGFARAAAARPELQLMIAGPDQAGWRPQLETLAATHGIADRVIFPGGLFGGLKWAALRAAEAFILPSHQENFGIAVAEALGCGTPVLISDKVNIWREIDEGGAGLVAPDTTDGVVSLVSRWLAMDGDARSAMAAAAERLFKERFNVANTALALLKTVAAEIGIDLPDRR